MPAYDWENNTSTDPDWSRSERAVITDLSVWEEIRYVVRCCTDSGDITRLAELRGKPAIPGESCGPKMLGQVALDESGTRILKIVEHRPFRIVFPDRMTPAIFETPTADEPLLSKISGQVICGATV